MENIVYFVAAFFLLVLAFVIFRIVVRRNYQRKRRLTWLSVLLEFFIFALHANFSYIYLPAEWPNLPMWPENSLLNAIGLIMLVGGFVGVAIGMIGLGFKRLFGREVGEIKQTGLYGLSRNPQIIAYGIMVLGWAVLWPSWQGLGWVALYGVISHMMVITEEEYLREVDSEAYERYCEHVPRYISLFWRK